MCRIVFKVAVENDSMIVAVEEKSNIFGYDTNLTIRIIFIWHILLFKIQPDTEVGRNDDFKLDSMSVVIMYNS